MCELLNVVVLLKSKPILLFLTVPLFTKNKLDILSVNVVSKPSFLNLINGSGFPLLRHAFRTSAKFPLEFISIINCY